MGKKFLRDKILGLICRPQPQNYVYKTFLIADPQSFLPLYHYKFNFIAEI